ncbi:MAG: alkyl sulfatase dimerization domain-containing protein [Pseudomonadota bacterium]
MFASHHWPVWGADDIELQLRQHRDLYRRLHDRTLRYANAGATLDELPSLVEEPSFATENMSVRGYYGSHRHNSKAVYQHYFGWWGGNPADFDTHPPVERGRRFVEAVGGDERAVELGKDAFLTGDYKWAAEVFASVVFSDPKNKGGASSGVFYHASTLQPLSAQGKQRANDDRYRENQDQWKPFGGLRLF